MDGSELGNYDVGNISFVKNEYNATNSIVNSTYRYTSVSDIEFTTLSHTETISHSFREIHNESFVNPSEAILSDESLIGLIILYSLTTALSIAGNTLVVVVFSRGRRSRTDLRFFLINLAASDLIMATFCMPFTFADTILGHWVFSKPMCPIVLFMQLLSVAASVFTNMAIGIDRFMAVTFPLHSRITYKRGKYVIVIVWICSISLSLVQLVVGKGIDAGYNYVHCTEDWPTLNSRRTFTVFILFLTYIVPLFILLITYSVIGLLLWKRTAPGNKHENRDLHQLRTKIKVTEIPSPYLHPQNIKDKQLTKTFMPILDTILQVESDIGLGLIPPIKVDSNFISKVVFAQPSILSAFAISNDSN